MVDKNNPYLDEPEPLDGAYKSLPVTNSEPTLNNMFNPSQTLQ
jgi:hypothetical protein